MSLAALTLSLMEVVAGTPLGGTAEVSVSTSREVDHVRRWCHATGNTVLAVRPDVVEIYRGRVRDPVEALPAERRPGYRLWIYSNFHCNLACDYCCAASSRSASPRVISIESFSALVRDAEAAGVRELYVTGGEPFLLVDLDERLRVATSALPTTVLTNATLWRGSRLRRLAALPREGLTLQISLDSADPPLHDRHRGTGAFARATAGIRTALDLGFEVRVAATLGDDAGDEERRLQAFFDQLGLSEDQRLVRRVARQGLSDHGLVVSRASLIPEVCVTADGVYWHPVAPLDPTMRVTPRMGPLAAIIEAIRQEYRDYRLRSEVLATSFPCA